MKYVVGNAQHIGQRSQQQDSFCFSNPGDAQFVAHAGMLAVLADGMGGLSHGDAAGRAGATAFLSAYRRKTSEEPVPDALHRSLAEANAAVYALAQERGSDGELGTTLVAAVLRENELHWISVGDSGLFLRRAGELAQLNTPHVYAHDLDDRVARGEITREAALEDPQREALTSHVGLAAIPLIDRSLKPVAVHPDDVIVLASDGLFKTLTREEMLAAMEGPLQQQCEALVHQVVAKGAANQDNTTVMALAAVEESAETIDHTPPEVPEAGPSGGTKKWAVLVAGVLLAALAGAGFWWHTQTAGAEPAQPPAAAGELGP